MMKTELSQRKFTSLSLIDLSEQAKFFKSTVINHPITVSDDYSDWWAVKYTSLVPTALKLSGTRDVRKRWICQLPETTKRVQSHKSTMFKLHTPKRGKNEYVAQPLRRRTRSTTQLPHAIPPLTSTPVVGTMIVESDHSSSTSGPSADQETELDDYVRLAISLASLKRRKVLPKSHSDDVAEKPLTTDSHSQDLSTRRAMVSSVEEILDLDFDFRFLDSGPSHVASSSDLPSGLELATAKASLQNFLNMNLNALENLEKTTILSAVSILKSSPDFPLSPLHDVLNALPTIFSAFQDSSSTCSETLIQVQNFKEQKKKLDGMLSERKVAMSTLNKKKLGV
ncbi:uncharacterized protein [Primulina eburnea]|uniref:uncharacterized protein n=1 Tax=Primulina eburnea TaxID=1245227 RepID=UPI003C6C041F